MTKIGIIGYGFVGKAVELGFSNLDPIYYDKHLESSSLREVAKCDFVFVCLPTPYKGDKIDLSIMDDSIKEICKISKNIDNVIIIKSTIVPGTTQKYINKYKKRICFSPEFLREKYFLYDFVNPDRIIIGAKDKTTMRRVRKLFDENIPDKKIFETDPTSAEMTKYMSNCFLATKVMFANEMFDLCKKLKIDYEKIKDMVISDRRIGNSHFDVAKERGFGGKCFPKDIIALIGLFDDHKVDATLLKTVWKKNLKIRKVKDWEDIPFVKSE